MSGVLHMRKPLLQTYQLKPCPDPWFNKASKPEHISNLWYLRKHAVLGAHVTERKSVGLSMGTVHELSMDLQGSLHSFSVRPATSRECIMRCDISLCV